MTGRTNITRKSKRLRVLVAEDDYPWRFTIVRLVEALGVECVAVENGLEAAVLLQDVSQPFALAITDFRMPRGSGWRVIAAARKYRGASFPVILQTAESQYPDVYLKARRLRVPLIAKSDIYSLLVPAVKQALKLSDGE